MVQAPLARVNPRAQVVQAVFTLRHWRQLVTAASQPEVTQAPLT